MVFSTPSFVALEIEKTNELIAQTGFEGDIHFRPPYGKKLFTLPYYLNRKDITTVTWDVAPEAYLGKNASPDEIADYTVDNTKPGSIILLHVMYDVRKNSMDAVPLIIKRLKEQGYRFVSVSDLMSADGS